MCQLEHEVTYVYVHTRTVIFVFSSGLVNVSARVHRQSIVSAYIANPDPRPEPNHARAIH